MSQRDAQRIGICFVDADTFWWKADDAPVCPACSRDDEGYLANHRFFVAEDRQLIERIAKASGADQRVRFPTGWKVRGNGPDGWVSASFDTLGAERAW